jgi:hypothetical protein
MSITAHVLRWIAIFALVAAPWPAWRTLNIVIAEDPSLAVFTGLAFLLMFFVWIVMAIFPEGPH